MKFTGRLGKPYDKTPKGKSEKELKKDTLKRVNKVIT